MVGLLSFCRVTAIQEMGLAGPMRLGSPGCLLYHFTSAAEFFKRGDLAGSVEIDEILLMYSLTFVLRVRAS